MTRNLDDWPFPDDPDKLVLTTRQVMEGREPVREVYRCEDLDDDEIADWQFLCGTTNNEKDGVLIHFHHMLELCPEAAEVGDLPVNWGALRRGSKDRWRRAPVDPDTQE
jgi:hypothetical protein